jgi:hypothetical protein
MTATLQLVREGRGIELRRGTFDVVLDGADVGSIEWHDTFDLPLDPGEHALQVTHGRFVSPTRAFRSADGEVVRFRCHGALIWPLWVASIVKPDLAISLRRE